MINHLLTKKKKYNCRRQWLININQEGEGQNWKVVEKKDKNEKSNKYVRQL